MPHFIFKAKKPSGETHKGEQDAKDRFELYKMIKTSGEEVISVEENKKMLTLNSISIPFINSIRTQEKINFSRSLGAMIKAGLSMSQALSVMERQGTNKKVKSIISTLNEDVRKGKPLSDAMGSFKNMFSSLMIAMVHSGEQSGTMSESLRIVTLQMEKNYTLQRRIRGALLYPAVILLAMIIITIILLTYVVPTLTKTFTELHLSLPISTRIVLFISNALQNDGIIIFTGFIILYFAFYLWSKSARGKNIIHKIILKIPLIGNLIKEVNVARTARTLSSLIESDVDILESLRITSDIVQNVHYRKVLEKSATAVEKGDPLSKVFSENPDIYPIFMSEMINVGEETGKIGEMLIGVAVYYEEDVDQKTKDMSTVIEPFLMIVIAVAVGFFAVAMITPMYSLVDAI
ncbi:MAG TPA: type II secretion system F family protein [Candidatus Paceibacterota bacterium]